ncbi:MAG: sigma-70 family RNA polymerase sigma factor [Candidatus Zixiibacteriota bacterium]
MSINRLFDAAKKGQKGAQEQLFASLSVRFSAIVSQRIGDTEDGKDIVQTAIMTIAEQFDTIDIQISFSAWAHKVLAYRLLNYYRDRKQKGINELNYLHIKSGKKPKSTDPMLESRLIYCLRKISAHNIYYARALNLFYQGFSTGDVCNKLNVSQNHVYVILSRARSMLKACLERGGESK